MIRLCREAGLAEPEYSVSDGFVTTIRRRHGKAVGEVTPEVARLLRILQGEMSRAEIMAQLGLRDEKHFRETYQQVAIVLGLIEMTRPPQSRLQKQRLTSKGRAVAAGLKPGSTP